MQRLGVTRGMVIEDYQIEFQSLRTEVLVRAQKLSRHRHIFFSLETQNHNRQVATDAVAPQARLRQTIQRQNMWPRTQRGVEVKNAAGQSLKKVGLVRIDMQVRHLDLRPRPGHPRLALKYSRVKILFTECERLFTRFRDAGGENDLDTFVLLQT